MATLIRTIARRCIDDYEGVTLRCFYAVDDQPTWGYCTDRLKGVLLEETLSRKPATMGVCIDGARNSLDFVRAHRLLSMNARDTHPDGAIMLQSLFMAVLAHEIKLELIDRLPSDMERLQARVAFGT